MAGGGMVVTASGKEYPEKLTTFVLVTCLIASTGGLIFGYDMGITGGVTSMDSFLDKFFPGLLEKQKAAGDTDHYCRLDCHRLTMFTSSLYVAALTSSFLASVMTRMFGRKWSIFCGGLTFLMGSTINAFADNFASLVIGRGFVGIGIGFAIQSVPVYLSEFAPTTFRGRLNIVFQLMVTIGILVANLVNFGAEKLSDVWGWRVSLGLAGIPGVIITVGALALPDTPNSLVERGYRGKAKTMLQKTRGVINVQAEFEDIVVACEKAKSVQKPWSTVLGRRYRPQLAVAIIMPFFQQMTGINVIIFYAPVLLKTIGLGDNASLVAAMVIGVINVLGTLVSIAVVDNFGRRFLLLQGGGQMFICQLVVGTVIALMFGTSGEAEDTAAMKSYALLVVVFICLYVAAFAWSWGPVGWLVPSEIFPHEVRSVGQSITVSVNMLFTFLIAQVFLSMLCSMKFGLFYFFCGWVAIMTAFVGYFLPETKNVPIEDIVHIWKSHWFWRRFMCDEQL